MFTKKDLKPGMLVVYRRGDCRVVMEHAKMGMVFVGDESSAFAENFNDNLQAKVHVDDFDIMEVYGNDGDEIDLLKNSVGNRTLIWKREEVKEVTMAEIEEKFGCKVKIIS